MIDNKKIAKGAAITALIDIIKAKADAEHVHKIADVTGLQDALDAAASAEHTHEISEVNGLQDALNGKAEKVHTHVHTDITDWDTELAKKAEVEHAHEISEVTGLQGALDLKANAAEVYTKSETYTKGEVDAKVASIYKFKGSKDTIADVLALEDAVIGDVWDVKQAFTLNGVKLPAGTNVACVKAATPSDETAWDALSGEVDLTAYATKQEMSSALEGKAEKVHTHVHTDITDWDTELAKKAEKTHAHEISDVTGLQDALDGKAATVHTHAHTDITDWDTELAKKAEKTHTHEISEVNGLQNTLDGKADKATVDAYTVNGKAISTNPNLVAADIEVTDFKLSDKVNDQLMPSAGDNVAVVFGKVYKAIQDNEDVTAAAFNAINAVMGTQNPNFSMADLSDTNYLNGLATFVAIVKKLDTELKAARDEAATLRAELDNELTAADIEAEFGEIEPADIHAELAK